MGRLAKGYGIVLVVLAHAFRGLLNNDIGAWTPTTRFFDAWIYACHMPLFFLGRACCSLDRSKSPGGSSFRIRSGRSLTRTLSGR